LLNARSEHLLRELAPQVLGTVTRRFHDFAAGRTTSLPERDYLIAQAARLSESATSGEQGNGVR
jgi:hypothetical protein